MKSGPKYPYLRKDREYESTINKYRVSMGMTIKELCKIVDCSTDMFVKLSNGTITPYYLKTKKIRPYVENMVKLFGVPLSELFPRYICDIENHNAKHILPNQVKGIIISEFSACDTNPSVLYEIKERYELIEYGISYLTRRQKKILKYWTQEKTLVDIGLIMDLSKERIRQIIVKSLQIIKRHIREKEML